MTFTYAGTLSTNLDRVRFWLHDITQNAGPLPGDVNFTDSELDGLLTVEGSWQRAVAAGYEALAAAWLRHVSSNADGLQLARSDIAKGYAEQAKRWRLDYGTSSKSLTASTGGRAVTRMDGYSDDVDNFEV